MADLTLPIIVLTSMFGYFMSDNRERIRTKTDSIPVPRELGNQQTIHQSNMVYDAEKHIYDKMRQNYVDSRDPENTNVIPPIYNTYGTRATNNLDVLGINDTKSVAQYNEMQRLSSLHEPGPEADIKSAPMFRSTVEYGKERTSKLYTELENLGGQEVSLLTGEEIDKRHNNMVPFFGGTVKQNTEGFKNSSRLELYTGAKESHIHKHEIESLQDKLPENIYGNATYTTTVDTDRFIPGYHRTNEAPIERKNVSAPIAGTFENKIRPVYRTVDELRVNNNPKNVYKQRHNHGQIASVRGIAAPVEKNGPDTAWDWGKDKWFGSNADVSAAMSQDNFENIKHTNRPETNISYYGIGNKDVNSSYIPLTTASDTNTGLSTLQQFPKRSQHIPGENAFRNAGDSSRYMGDYGKKGFENIADTQRQTTQQTHVLNVGSQVNANMSKYTDSAQVTIKDQTLKQPYEIQGQVSSDYSTGQSGAVESGAADYQVKSNQKESQVKNKYEQGIRHHNFGLGYVSTKYNVNTTNKEMTTNDPRSDYKGTAIGSEMVDPTSRIASNNAQISMDKETLVSNEHNSGPQKFNIQVGKEGYGHVRFDDNTLFSEKENTVKLNIEPRTTGPSKDHIGDFDDASKKYTVESGHQRMDSSIYKQLNDNIFYNNNLKAHINNPVDYESSKNKYKKAFFKMQL
jgi:hypothetical protein